jgi:hypothetical protein
MRIHKNGEYYDIKNNIPKPILKALGKMDKVQKFKRLEDVYSKVQTDMKDPLSIGHVWIDGREHFFIGFNLQSKDNSSHRVKAFILRDIHTRSWNFMNSENNPALSEKIVGASSSEDFNIEKTSRAIETLLKGKNQDYRLINKKNRFGF